MYRVSVPSTQATPLISYTSAVVMGGYKCQVCVRVVEFLNSNCIRNSSSRGQKKYETAASVMPHWFGGSDYRSAESGGPASHRQSTHCAQAVGCCYSRRASKCTSTTPALLSFIQRIGNRYQSTVASGAVCYRYFPVGTHRYSHGTFTCNVVNVGADMLCWL